MFGRRKTAALVAEFLGTFTLVLVIISVTATMRGALFAAIAAGLALALVSLTFGKISGAQINPAITLGLWTVRKLETTHALAYMAVQFLGGYVALEVARMYKTVDGSLMRNGDWTVVVAEVIGTFVFAMGVAAAVSRAYEGGKMAGALGMSLGIGILVASLGSPAVLNPAVALGLDAWSAMYIVGPLTGAVLGFGVYQLLFAPLDAPRPVQRVQPVVSAPVVAKKASVTTKKPVAKKTTRKRK